MPHQLQKQFAWEDLTVAFQTRPLTGVQELKYSTEKEWVQLYGKGAQPIANQPGNETYTGTITVLRHEVEGWRTLAPGGVITQFRDGVITATYSRLDDGEEITVQDTLTGVHFTSAEYGLAQGDTHETIVIPFVFLDIKRIPPTLPRIGSGA